MPVFETKEDQKHEEVVCLLHILECFHISGDLLALYFDLLVKNKCSDLLAWNLDEDEHDDEDDGDGDDSGGGGAGGQVMMLPICQAFFSVLYTY